MALTSQQSNGEVEESQKLADRPDTPTYTEIGAVQVSSFANLADVEYNSALWFPDNIAVYDRMKRSDGQVRGTLRMVKTPVISAQWYVEPATDSPQDILAAEFVDWTLHRMSRTWTQVLWEALLSMDYGFYTFEKVWEEAIWRPKAKGAKPRKVVKWRKLAPRHPRHLVQWHFDAAGGVSGIRYGVYTTTGYEEKDISIEKLLIFTFDEEGGDPFGLSILRSAYPHWYIKQQMYKIDGVQKERHGIGVPEIGLPVGYTPKDLTLARQLGRNMRTNEKAFIVKLPNWEVGFAAIPTNPANALESAEHHDLMIARNLLVQFLNITSEQRSSSGPQQDMFLKAMRYVANFIRGVFNQYAIPQLVNYNFPNITEYPQLQVRRIGESAEARTLSVALHNLVNAGVITPDGTDEDFVREVIELPRASEESRERSMEDRITPRSGVGRKSQSGGTGATEETE